jgi:hypothetical protein
VEALEGRTLLSTYTVHNTNDSGTGSLRQAIIDANTTSGADTINFDSTVFNVPQTITLTSGELAVTDDLTIQGPGANLLTVSGNNASRVFQIDGGVTAEIDGLTITKGNTSGGPGAGNVGFGGGIDDQGASLTLNNDLVTDNSDGGTGTGSAAGVFVGSGSLKVNDCTISNNSAGFGAGIEVGDASSLITNSAIINNTAIINGGGVANAGVFAPAAMQIINCTLSGNSANSGSAIYTVDEGALASLVLQDCTIAGNTGSPGFTSVVNDPFSGASSITYQGTIFSSASTGTNISNLNSNGTVTSLGHNISSDSTGNLTATGDLPNTNPLLAPLGNYGGPTPTMPPLPGSPAIGAGVTIAIVTTDQRGVTRPATPDIGAVQTSGYTITATPADQTQSTTVNTAFGNPLQVTVTPNSANDPVVGGTVKYTVTPAGGGASATLSSATATIATGGTASVTATANTTAGSYGVSASAAGVATSATFNLTNTPGAVASVTVVSGSNQSTTVTTAFANALEVVVTDTFGNPVPGVSVTFVGPATGASASVTGSPATTNSNGQASVTATANTTAGSFVETATVAGVATPANFNLTNTPGAAASVTVVSGSNQSATVGTSFANPLVVVVKDTFGNPVPGVSVTFAGPATGASATLTGSPATTGANGQASVTAKANTIAGVYTVTASVAGVATSAIFNLDNTYQVVALFDQTTPHNSGSTIPIVIKLTDALGNNVGSSSLRVTAVSVIGPSGPVPLQSPGNSQPGNLFKFDPTTGTYQFNLKTTGYKKGSYIFNFTIGSDPMLQSVRFVIR